MSYKRLDLKGPCGKCEPAEAQAPEDLVKLLGLDMDKNSIKKRHTP